MNYVKMLETMLYCLTFGNEMSGRCAPQVERSETLTSSEIQLK